MATLILVILGIYVAPIYGIVKLFEWCGDKERGKKVENFLKGLGLCFLGLFYWAVFSFFAAFSPWKYALHILKGLSFTLLIFGPVLYWIVFPLRERWHDKGKHKRFYAVMTPIVIIFLIFLGAAFLPP